MAYLEIPLKDLKKDNIINIVLNLQSERKQFIEHFLTYFDKMFFIFDKQSRKFEKVESSLLVNQKLNSSLTTRVGYLDR